MKTQPLWRAGLLLLTGSVLVGVASYYVLAGVAYSAIAPVDPEWIYFPTIVLLTGVGLAWLGTLWSAGAASGFRILAYTVAIGSTVVSAIPVALTTMVLAEPIYRENRALTLNVWWGTHTHFPNRVVFQFQEGGIWLTLQEQRGLQEHLRALNRPTAELEVTALLRSNGEVSRFRVHRLAGFALEQEHFAGNYLQTYVQSAKERTTAPTR